MILMRLTPTGVLAGVALISLAVAAGGCGGGSSQRHSASTKAQYDARLRAADARSAKAEAAALASLRSRTSTAADVKAKFFAMGKAHIAVGKEFASLTPPAAAAKANADIAHAEIVFGRQNEAIARKLPGTKAAIAKYIQSLKPPSGGDLLDRAIAELHAAGFGTKQR